MSASGTFSDAERDRRWSETRQRMAEPGIDALVMLPTAGRQDVSLANQRYLSQISTGRSPQAMVFPQAGDPTVIVLSADEVAGSRPTSWVDDIRGSDGEQLGRVIADRLKELKLERSTIGVPYSEGRAESPLPIGALDVIRRELPHGRLVDATALMEDQRSVKSDEEIAALERATAIAERGIFTLGYHVRVGMLQTEALSILQGAILKAGGELGNQIGWECASGPRRVAGCASATPIAGGDILQNEVEARVAGYRCSEVHPICVGKPPQQVYEMFELSGAVFKEALPLLVPGALTAAVLDAARRAAEGTSYVARLIARGRGLAIEPVGERLHERQVITLESSVRSAEGLTIAFSGTSLVTSGGGRRLGKRPMELMLTSRSLLSAYVEFPDTEPTAPWLESGQP